MDQNVNSSNDFLDVEEVRIPFLEVFAIEDTEHGIAFSAKRDCIIGEEKYIKDKRTDYFHSLTDSPMSGLIDKTLIGFINEPDLFVVIGSEG